MCASAKGATVRAPVASIVGIPRGAENG